MSFIVALLANLFVGCVDTAHTNRKARQYKERSAERVEQWNDYQKQLADITKKVNSQYRNQFN